MKSSNPMKSLAKRNCSDKLVDVIASDEKEVFTPTINQVVSVCIESNSKTVALAHSTGDCMK